MRSRSGSLIALGLPVDYGAMKALMEASREQSVLRRDAKVKELRKPDSKLAWKYFDHLAKEPKAA